MLLLHSTYTTYAATYRNPYLMVACLANPNPRPRIRLHSTLARRLVVVVKVTGHLYSFPSHSRAAAAVTSTQKTTETFLSPWSPKRHMHGKRKHSRLPTHAHAACLLNLPTSNPPTRSRAAAAKICDRGTTRCVVRGGKEIVTWQMKERDGMLGETMGEDLTRP